MSTNLKPFSVNLQTVVLGEHSRLNLAIENSLRCKKKVGFYSFAKSLYQCIIIFYFYLSGFFFFSFLLFFFSFLLCFFFSLFSFSFFLFFLFFFLFFLVILVYVRCTFLL